MAAADAVAALGDAAAALGAAAALKSEAVSAGAGRPLSLVSLVCLSTQAILLCFHAHAYAH